MKWLNIRHAGWVVTGILVACAVALAVVLVGVVDDPAVVVAMLVGCALAGIIVMSGAISLAPEDTRSEATERTLRVATATLGHLHGGLTAENARAICAMLLPETSAAGIAITDTETVLAYEGTIDTPFVPGSKNAKPTLEVLESKRMETFVSVDQESQDVRRFSIGNRRQGHAFGIIVPLLVQEHAVGTVKLYYRRDVEIDRTQLAIAEGLGTLLSTQLSSYELDRGQGSAGADQPALSLQHAQHHRVVHQDKSHQGA